MPRFKFKLESVLKIRSIKEDLVKEKFGAKNLEVEDRRERIKSIDKEIEGFRNSLDWNQNHNANDLQSTQMWMISLKRKRIEGVLKLNELVKEKEVIRGELIEATREKKAIEKLREKHLEEFKLEQKKKEQSFSDEMASVRHGFNL